MNSPTRSRRVDTPASRTAVLGSGVTLSYVEQGDASGMPLVLLHGYSDSCRSFEPLLDALPRRFRAIAPSQRGHGDSDKPRSRYDAALLADDLAEFLDCLGIERAVIAGHSMGSLVAQRFAIDRPKRTLALVLLGAFKTLSGNAEGEGMWRETVATLTDPVDPQFVRAFQQSTLAQSVPPDFFETIMAESLKVPAHVWRSALRGLLDEDFSRELGRIAAPTLILWGDRDTFSAHDEQQALQAAIPAAGLVTYAGAGHALHWEAPVRTAADIAAFVAARPWPSPDPLLTEQALKKQRSVSELLRRPWRPCAAPFSGNRRKPAAAR